MKTRSWITPILLAAVAVILFKAVVAADEPAKGAKAEECVYVGVKKCAFCHVRLDNSLRTWAITKHANALNALRTPDAKRYSERPDEDPRCLKCHMTGTTSDPHYEGKFQLTVPDNLEGVQCEMCHGPGNLYKTEMARALPKEHPLNEQECSRRGLIIPNEKTCRKCHNEECPVFHGFNFEEAVKMIKHGKTETKCQYIGQDKCAFCHMKTNESEPTWVILKHINAFSVLRTKLALKFSKDPVHDEKCLECHATGLNAPGGYKMGDPQNQKLEGVQCEMCHGWGYSYVETMAKAKVLDVCDRKDECVHNGLIIPDEKVCLRCHNERCPVYVGFDFQESLKQIRHNGIFRKP